MAAELDPQREIVRIVHPDGAVLVADGERFAVR
jgi:hypothetical protein